MRGKKLDVYEGGIHVPAFANWKGTIEPRRVDTPTHVVDWFPTLAALLEYRPAEPIAWDGIDVTTAVEGSDSLPERRLYWTWGSRENRRALSDGRYKIVHYGQPAPTAPGDWQLFDLLADPEESEDVAATHPDVLAALHARYVAERERDGRD